MNFFILARARLISLENLALALIKLVLKQRVIRSLNNFTGVQSDVKNAIIKSGEFLFNIRILLQIKNWERLNIVIFVIERKVILAKTETNSE